MFTNKLVGMGVALVTPFKKDFSVDFEALEKLVEFQIQNGTDYLVVLGTTGETPTLKENEKKQIIDTVIKVNQSRLPIVLGVGGNDTMGVINQISKTDFSHIDAILSVAPYYNKPSQEGLYQHYSTIAKSTNMPIILYNVPGRTGVNISAETTIRLAREFDSIVAIKEASGNFKQIDEIIKNKPSNFMVISGDDGITFPLITLGAVGVISVVGNAFPKEFSKMVRLALRGDLQGARAIHYHFVEMIDLLFRDGNPAGVKSILSCMGYIENVLRLPLVPTTTNTSEKLNEILKNLKSEIAYKQ
ncbi:MAG: 4-hydroxy-tetrahydrodipicolinate synthase [Paludibacteraceae bacterium]|nr:4-hydroxy-tetrahydrodipicolinate synthase [Paludibacteraceae bacterium]